MFQLTFLIMAFSILVVLGMVHANGRENQKAGFSGRLETATFAGGCFWCMEPPFDKLDGVLSATSGYTGGDEHQATYEKVSSGQTEHLEAVKIVYDPEKITYEELLDVFWKNIDPTQKNGQFADIGKQYRTAIFFHDENQHELALKSKEKLNKSGKFDRPIVTEILPAKDFYPAEEYHQEYYSKKPVRYNYYRFGSGRGQFLEKLWGEQ